MRAGFPANSARQSKPDSVSQAQFLMPDLLTMLDARQPLYRLAQTIDWKQFEIAFGPLYVEEGRPALGPFFQPQTDSSSGSNFRDHVSAIIVHIVC
jgi:hypothetical protein